MDRRVFLIVLDSFGIGHGPDSHLFGDLGANTLKSIKKSSYYHTPMMEKLGLGKIHGVEGFDKNGQVVGSYGALIEKSMGKDTTVGHWEIAGIISKEALPTYPQGFLKEDLDRLSLATGRGILCNRPYSGTQVLEDYGKEHMESGDLIVYTSADSVLQIAAHEEVVPLKELYQICQQAREIFPKVGRVIARPFLGSEGSFWRTANRHDYSLEPPGITMMDQLCKEGYQVIGVGKIADIFAGKGITSSYLTKNNQEGMERVLDLVERDFKGLCFINLVDFDMVYGHRNDVEGYAKAISLFDKQLGILLQRLRKEDILMITADHGCDPAYPGTDHTRERTPLLVYGHHIKQGYNLGVLESFSDIGASVVDIFGIFNQTQGTSFWKKIYRENEDE